MLAEEEKALRIRANTLVIQEQEHIQREKDLKQKQNKRKLLRLEIINIIESLPFISLISLIFLLSGMFVGINLSDVAGCYEENTSCQLMRWRKKVNY